MPNPKLLLIVAIVIITMLSVSYANAQDSYLKDQWTIKISANPSTIENRNLTEESFPYMLGNVSYGISNNFEVGVSLGINFTAMVDNVEFAAYAYGWFQPIGEYFVNFHPLTLLFEDKEPLFDLYLSARVGGIYVAKKHWLSGLYSYTQLGSGLGVNITKRLGVFSEYNHQLSDLNNLKISGWRFGLTSKF